MADQNLTGPKENFKLRKLSSSDPEARDEGPRLLPLAEEHRHEFPLEVNSRYMDLADAAIGRRQPAATRPKKPNLKIGAK